jgi:hypothetical protein
MTPDVNDREIKKHYRDISYGENRDRLKVLTEFLDLVTMYFDNSTLNMISGSHVEKQEAAEARALLNPMLNSVYQIIRLADIKTSALSSSSLGVLTHGKNIDLILNIFNLGRNNIPLSAALDYVERAIEIYKSNRLDAMIRTINPFFWVRVALKYR